MVNFFLLSAKIIIGNVIVADWFFYSLIGVIIFIFVVLFWWFYHSRLKIGNKAVFTTMMHGDKVKVWDNGRIVERIAGGVRVCLGEKEFKTGDRDIVYRGKTFEIDMSKPAYRWWGWTRYYYDFEDGSIITFGGEYQKLNPNDGDEFMSDGVIRRLANMMRERKQELTILIVMVVVVGVMAFLMGMFISPYILPVHNGTVITR